MFSWEYWEIFKTAIFRNISEQLLLQQSLHSEKDWRPREKITEIVHITEEIQGNLKNFISNVEIIFQLQFLPMTVTFETKCSVHIF